MRPRVVGGVLAVALSTALAGKALSSVVRTITGRVVLGAVPQRREREI